MSSSLYRLRRAAIRCALVSLVGHALSIVAMADDRVPISGDGPALAEFDRTMLEHLAKSRATAGTLAIMIDGRMRYTRGYGWLDQDHVLPTPADTPMRVASVSKPITAAVVRALVRSGDLTLDAPVFPILQLEPPAGTTLDPRWRQITIGELLKHEGGWDIKELGFDPMFEPARVHRDLELDHPTRPAEIVRWMMGKPLQFDPGQRSAYSNFGYCVLGRVIQRVIQRPYIAGVRQLVFRPAGIDPQSVWLAHMNDDQRDAREPWYNERLNVDVMDAHGGIVVNSPTLCQFLNAYWISGQLRKPGARGFVYKFFGSMPGTSAIVHQRLDGTNFACAFNARHADAPLEGLNKELNRLIDALNR